MPIMNRRPLNNQNKLLSSAVVRGGIPGIQGKERTHHILALRNVLKSFAYRVVFGKMTFDLG